jgi:hypothetical protein
VPFICWLNWKLSLCNLINNYGIRCLETVPSIYFLQFIAQFELICCLYSAYLETPSLIYCFKQINWHLSFTKKNWFTYANTTTICLFQISNFKFDIRRLINLIIVYKRSLLLAVSLCKLVTQGKTIIFVKT